MNQVRRDSVREAAQEPQSEEPGEGPVSRGPEANASNDAPTLVTPREEEENPGTKDLGGDTDIKGLEGPRPMELE